jgi:hypothetical protein
MEALRESSKLLHPEVLSISREEIQDTLKDDRKSLPYLSKYEYTVLLSTRIQQLAEGAKPLVDLKNMNQQDPEFLFKLATKTANHHLELPHAYQLHMKIQNQRRSHGFHQHLVTAQIKSLD